jgi:predicted RNA-binding protein
MCQVAVYLNEEKIMEDVMVVEPTPDGVRLIKLFELPHVIPATIRQINLMENKLILEPIEKGEVKHEGDG